MSVKNNRGQDEPPAKSRPAKPLNEEGLLAIFTPDEIEEMRSELAKRSKAIKRRLKDRH